MDAEMMQKFAEQDAKLEEIRHSVGAMKRYMQITFWATVIFFVVPLIGLLYAIPKAMQSYVGAIDASDLQDLQGLQGLQDLVL